MDVEVEKCSKCGKLKEIEVGSDTCEDCKNKLNSNY